MGQLCKHRTSVLVALWMACVLGRPDASWDAAATDYVVIGVPSSSTGNPAYGRQLQQSSATSTQSFGASPSSLACPAAIPVLNSSTSGTVVGTFNISGASNAAGNYTLYPPPGGCSAAGAPVFAPIVPELLFLFVPGGPTGTVSLDMCSGDLSVDSILDAGYCTGASAAVPFQCAAFDDDSCGLYSTAPKVSFDLDGSGRPVIIAISLWTDWPDLHYNGTWGSGGFVLKYAWIPPSPPPSPTATPSPSPSISTSPSACPSLPHLTGTTRGWYAGYLTYNQSYRAYPTGCRESTPVPFPEDAPQAVLQWTPPSASGIVSLSLCAGDSFVDTVMAAGYCGGASGFQCDSADDDSCGQYGTGTTSRVSFTLDGSGRPVEIVISTFSDQAQSIGAADFNLTYSWVSASPCPTPSPTPSVTPSNSKTASITPSNTRTASITPSNSRTPSVTPSVCATPSHTPTYTRTPTVTPSNSPSASVSRSTSRSPSVPASPSHTPSPSPTPCPSPVPVAGEPAALRRAAYFDTPLAYADPPYTFRVQLYDVVTMWTSEPLTYAGSVILGRYSGWLAVPSKAYPGCRAYAAQLFTGGHVSSECPGGSTATVLFVCAPYYYGSFSISSVNDTTACNVQFVTAHAAFCGPDFLVQEAACPWTATYASAGPDVSGLNPSPSTGHGPNTAALAAAIVVPVLVGIVFLGLGCRARIKRQKMRSPVSAEAPVHSDPNNDPTPPVPTGVPLAAGPYSAYPYGPDPFMGPGDASQPSYYYHYPQGGDPVAGNNSPAHSMYTAAIPYGVPVALPLSMPVPGAGGTSGQLSVPAGGSLRAGSSLRIAGLPVPIPLVSSGSFASCRSCGAWGRGVTGGQCPRCRGNNSSNNVNTASASASDSALVMPLGATLESPASPPAGTSSGVAAAALDEIDEDDNPVVPVKWLQRAQSAVVNGTGVGSPAVMVPGGMPSSAVRSRSATRNGAVTPAPAPAAVAAQRDDPDGSDSDTDGPVSSDEPAVDPDLLPLAAVPVGEPLAAGRLISAASPAHVHLDFASPTSASASASSLGPSAAAVPLGVPLARAVSANSNGSASVGTGGPAYIGGSPDYDYSFIGASPAVATGYYIGGDGDGPTPATMPRSSATAADS